MPSSSSKTFQYIPKHVLELALVLWSAHVPPPLNSGAMRDVAEHAVGPRVGRERALVITGLRERRAQPEPVPAQLGARLGTLAVRPALAAYSMGSSRTFQYIPEHVLELGRVSKTTSMKRRR